MTKNKIKTIVMVVAIILALTLAGGWIAQTVVSKQKEPITYTPVDETYEGMQMAVANEDNGIKLMSARIAVEDYDDYGVSAQAESAFTITATVIDEYGHSPEHIQQVTYSIAWASTNSEDINNYVTMNVNGASATFSCHKGFSTQIVVTCASDLDTTKKSTAILNNAKRITGVLVTVNGEQFSMQTGDAVNVAFSSYGEIGTAEWNSKFSIGVFAGYVFSSVGTVEDNGTSSPSFKYELTDEFKAKLNELKPSQLTINTKTSVNLGSHQSELLTNLIDLPYNSQNYSNWYYVMRAFEETTNQVKVTVSQSLKYTDGGLRTSYYLNCVVPKTKIGSVDMDTATFTF